jgi:hypothetical protein
MLLAHRAQLIRRRRHSSRTKSVSAHRSSDRRARDLPTLAPLLMLLAHRAQLIRRRRHSSRTKSVSAHRSSDRRARDLPTLAAFIDATSAARHA